ncbi:hypothetical protein Cpir12675_000289 [Ceratocystis pirilliformis]|uniref:ubiquitinyl hydrolase 1 n=1 Tax=Ceratocystis pirilliformis TaxID=259994 RepID=A0ABR3ZM64_9PEZI
MDLVTPAVTAVATTGQVPGAGPTAVNAAYRPPSNLDPHGPIPGLDRCISARDYAGLPSAGLAQSMDDCYPPLPHFAHHNQQSKPCHSQRLDVSPSQSQSQSQPPSSSSAPQPLDIFTQPFLNLHQQYHHAQPQQSQRLHHHGRPNRHYQNQLSNLRSAHQLPLGDHQPEQYQDQLSLDFGFPRETHYSQLVDQSQSSRPTSAVAHQHHSQLPLAQPLVTSVSDTSSAAVPRTVNTSTSSYFPTLEASPWNSSLSLLSAPGSLASTPPSPHYLHPQNNLSSPTITATIQRDYQLSIPFSLPLPISPLLYPSTAMGTNDDLSHTAAAFADDIAAQEALARDYQPDLQGPFVGDKISSVAITEAYARADPVYIEKTSALPQTYSHYRPIQGDGNCGWRAIAFSYFEKLAEIQDQTLIQHEILRLISFNDALEKVGGYDAMLFDDMAEQTITLLKNLSANISSLSDSMALITAAFNDADTQSAIMYHMRLLAATTIKGNPEYEPFTGGLGLAGFCSQVIELPNREIDHLGIDALAAALLRPINMVLQIVYLDRSKGTQPNTHQIPADGDIKVANEASRAIYLLFRPEHYDILYKGRIQVQINKVDVSYHNDNKFESAHNHLASFATFDFSQLAMIPGLSKFPSPAPSMPSKLPMSVGHGFMPMETNVWGADVGMSMAPSQKPPLVPASARTSDLRVAFDAVTPAKPPLPLYLHMPHSRQSMTPISETPSPIVQSPSTEMLQSMLPSLARPASSSPLVSATSSNATQQYPLRFSMQYFQLGDSFKQSQPVMSYKNSHFNRAHFKNPKFTPEQWTPRDDDEY